MSGMATGAAAVGWPEIDALHLEFEQCMEELRRSSDAVLDRSLEALNAHLLRHFGAEERWMLECALPVAACHKREHDAVFEVLDTVRRRCADGDRDIARRLIEELPRWFEIHVATHDAALADFLKQYTAASRASA
jgi:hemerythrin